MNRDVVDVRRRLTDLGWEAVPGRSTAHFVYRWPANGETVCVATSPSDWRWLRNTDAEVYRICGQRLRPKAASGHYTHKGGSGFSIDAAVTEQRRHAAAAAAREAEEDALIEHCEEVAQALAEVDPSAKPEKARQLARRYLSLSEEIERLGRTPPRLAPRENAQRETA